jgi:pimeloyl-ACP methyl ester carboxylesterase
MSAWKDDSMYTAYPKLIEDFCDTADGVHLELLRSKSLDGGIPVLMIPGMIGTASMLAERIEMIQPRPGIAFSHRGCGKSSSPVAGHYDFVSRCLDIKAVVDHYKLQEYFLYAFSRSVPMALQHALDHPTQVKGLILDDAEPVYPELTRNWTQRMIAAQFLWSHPFALERIQKESVEQDLYGRLPQIKAPVLIFRGEQDGSLLSLASALRMKAKLPDAELVHLPNSGHGASIEDFPDFRDAMVDFLSRLDPQNAAHPA